MSKEINKMTNAEKYRKEIENFNYNQTSFCKIFVEPKILKDKGLSCGRMSCNHCRMLQMLWLMDEYEEPEVDWSKVAVDTPILVREYEDGGWFKRYFAKYENGKVYAWDNGYTSWIGEEMLDWEYAKLAEEGDM